jgi:hypothetical protein
MNVENLSVLVIFESDTQPRTAWHDKAIEADFRLVEWRDTDRCRRTTDMTTKWLAASLCLSSFIRSTVMLLLTTTWCTAASAIEYKALPIEVQAQISM